MFFDNSIVRSLNDQAVRLDSSSTRSFCLGCFKERLINHSKNRSISKVRALGGLFKTKSLREMT
jgi:hypothetical protein